MAKATPSSIPLNIKSVKDKGFFQAAECSRSFRRGKSSVRWLTKPAKQSRSAKAEQHFGTQAMNLAIQRPILTIAVMARISRVRLMTRFAQVIEKWKAEANERRLGICKSQSLILSCDILSRIKC
jgi:hypothetical protein